MTFKTKLENSNLKKHARASSKIIGVSILAILVVGSAVPMQAFGQTDLETDCLFTANTEIKIGNYRSAIECYESVLREESNNLDALIGLSVANTGIEKYTEAREHAEYALVIEPDNLGALNALAMIQYKTNWLIEAKQMYQQVLNIDQFNVDANTGIGNTLRLLGDAEGATYYYWFADENSVGGSFDARNGFGIMQKEIFLQTGMVGNLDSAVFYHQLAIDIDPTSVDGWNGIGNVLVYKGIELDRNFCVDAIEAYTESLIIYEHNLDAIIGIGNALSCLGKYEEAIAYYEQALEIESGNEIAQKGKEVALAAIN